MNRAASAIAALLILSLGTVPVTAEQAKPFPQHWGEVPNLQTRDDVEWPGGYGRGSSTVAHWIEANLTKDNAADSAAATILASATFDAVAVGELPDDFMILNGDFAVREETGAKFMELPGTPLESYAVMFGPAGRENMEVSGRILGFSKGRRYPAFTIGLNGLGGYRLKVSPAKRALELYTGPEDGGELLANSALTWTSGQWVRLRLQVRKSGDSAWRIQGKAWMDGSGEPADWMVSHVERKEPLPGRPFVAASPYSGTPIRFDDLIVTKVVE